MSLAETTVKGAVMKTSPEPPIDGEARALAVREEPIAVVEWTPSFVRSVDAQGASTPPQRQGSDAQV